MKSNLLVDEVLLSGSNQQFLADQAFLPSVGDPERGWM